MKKINSFRLNVDTILPQGHQKYIFTPHCLELVCDMVNVRVCHAQAHAWLDEHVLLDTEGTARHAYSHHATLA